jgi:hypothetical protein
MGGGSRYLGQEHACMALELVGSWALGLMGSWAHGLSGSWALGSMGSRSTILMSHVSAVQ